MRTLSASGRLEISPAPGELLLVQELLNTSPVGGMDDLLDDTVTAAAWLDSATAAAGLTAPEQRSDTELSTEELVELRDLRAALREALSSAGATGGLNGMLELSMSAEGDVSATPRGRGVAWVHSAVLLGCYLAQQHDTWRRLKVCPNPLCAAAFYDRSRNNSGVWHNVRRCGNPTNLRASRARRRAASTPDSGETRKT